mgnify:FL=1
MMPNYSSDRQRGFLLITALGSLLVVGTVAAGLNVLIVQDAGTSSNTIEAMQNTSIEDSLYLFEKKKLETETGWEFVFNEDTGSLEVLDKDEDGNSYVLHKDPTRKWVRDQLSEQHFDDISGLDLEDFQKAVRDDLKETLYE